MFVTDVIDSFGSDECFRKPFDVTMIERYWKSKDVLNLAGTLAELYNTDYYNPDITSAGSTSAMTHLESESLARHFINDYTLTVSLNGGRK